MSDQVYEEPEGSDTSHQADVDAGFDDKDDDHTSVADQVAGAAADVVGDDPQSSHDADVDAGYDSDDDSPRGTGD
jgi:hypothetical protein